MKASDQQSPSPRRLLPVEDDDLTAATISELLTSHGFLVETVPGAAEAQRSAKDFDPDVALIDVSLGPGPTGADLALALSRSAPHVGLMLLTRHPDLRTAGLTRDVGDNVGTDTGKEGRVSAHASHQVPGSRPASQDEGRMRPPMLRSKSSPNWTRTNNPYVTSSGGNSSCRTVDLACCVETLTRQNSLLREEQSVCCCVVVN
ncbi:MAG: response regulator [Actinomycetia bacterium]|nr:response regulator [Actinomycetes bacterium]